MIRCSGDVCASKHTRTPGCAYLICQKNAVVPHVRVERLWTYEFKVHVTCGIEKRVFTGEIFPDPWVILQQSETPIGMAGDTCGHRTQGFSHFSGSTNIQMVRVTVLLVGSLVYGDN